MKALSSERRQPAWYPYRHARLVNFPLHRSLWSRLCLQIDMAMEALTLTARGRGRPPRTQQKQGNAGEGEAMTRRNRSPGSWAFAVAAAATIAICAMPLRAQEGPFKVGLSGALTGGDAILGQTQREGVQ